MPAMKRKSVLAMLHPLILPVRVVSRTSTDTLAHPHPTIRQALNFIHLNLANGQRLSVTTLRKLSE